MPKQGHFAKSTRRQQLNNFKVKRQNMTGTISEDDFTDYLLVRFALTAKKRVPQPARETVQRLLIEIADNLLANQGDLTALVPQLFQDINHRAPWQFYLQVLPEWELIQDFLKKEVPAVPLKQRCYITREISTDALTQLVGQLMAQKAAAVTLLKTPQAGSALQQQTAQLLLPTLYHDNQLDWVKVRALLAPFPFQVDEHLDAASRDWLTKLSHC